MTLLQTKLNKPPMHTSYIEREKINGLLADYHNYKMVLVSAPAGSGKSTVINAWLNTIKTSYSWYSLDPSDNDVQQFLSYIIAGLESVETFGAYQLSDLLASIQSIGTDGLIRSIINVLYEADYPMTLILDDYHLISNQDIHRIITLFIEHLPSHVHLVIITREDPPLPLSKLRVSRQLLEIRVNELQFDTQEACQFMADTMGLDMTSASIEALNKKTEGWIAGLQLAGLSLQSHPNPTELIHDFTGNHYIVDYLLEEVLGHMDQTSLDFLLATSILRQFTAGLCDNLLDLKPGTSKKQLNILSRSNAFIIPLDHHRQWFRYHHLFRDLLKKRLESTSFDIGNLHKRASLWFMTQGNVDLAIHHAFEAGAPTLAAKFIENMWAECDRNLQAKPWLEKLQKLPMDLVERRPVLLMGYGWALLDTGKHLEAETWLKKAKELYDAIQSGETDNYLISDQVQYDLLPSTIASAYCYIAIGQGQFDAMFNYAEIAFNHKAHMTTHRSGVLRMLMGLAHWSVGDMANAKYQIDKAIIDIKENEGAITIGTYEIVRIELLMDAGHFDQASDMLDQVISQTLMDRKIPLALANFHLIYSRLHLAKGNIDKAIKSHELSKTYGIKFCLPDYWYKWYQQLATLQIHQGLYISALQSLGESEAHFYLTPLPSRTSPIGLKGYLYLLLNRFSDAHICFDNLFAEQDLIYKSLYLAKTGKHGLAEDMLANLYKTAMSQGRMRSASEILLGQAVTAKFMGQDDNSMKYLHESLGFINEHCYIEPLLRYQNILGDLYTDLDLAGQVKENLSLESLDDSYTIFQANQQLIEPLTPRELEIIQLLSDGYSNQEICDELFLALSTVKGHNQNLFGKLGVRRRTEAISQARTIGLIK